MVNCVSRPKHPRGGVILAGGGSSRFNGHDKSLLDLGNGRTLVQEVARRLQFLDEMVVSTSSEERAHRYHELTGLKAVVDEYPGIPGGILSGCRALNAPEVLVVGVDMPLLKKEVIECQFSAMQGYQAVVPRHPNGFIEPLHSTMDRVSVLGPLKTICEAGVLRVSRLFELVSTYYMPVEAIKSLDPDLDCFANVNDERTLRSILLKLEHSPPQARNSRSSSSRSARALTSSLERD